jgi:prephenate dehydrogenase
MLIESTSEDNHDRVKAVINLMPVAVSYARGQACKRERVMKEDRIGEIMN